MLTPSVAPGRQPQVSIFLARLDLSLPGDAPRVAAEPGSFLTRSACVKRKSWMTSRRTALVGRSVEAKTESITFRLEGSTMSVG